MTTLEHARQVNRTKGKKNDKEKSIKPEWLIEVREWLGAMAPQGKLHEYFRVDFLSEPGWVGSSQRPVRKVVITFFTHTHQYMIEISETQFDVVKVLKRKAYAGSDTIPYLDIVNPCPRTHEMWVYVMNQIMAWEMVKIIKDERQTYLAHWESHNQQLI